MKKTGFKQKARKPLKRTQLVRKTPPRTRLTSKHGKVPISKLKKRLDAIFSKYIRQIHPARCYTCGKVSERTKLQCGHFVSRQYLATRWDERNCRPQCAGCNIFGNGQLLDFEDNLIRDLGKDVVDELKASRHKILKLDSLWYEREIEKYTQLLSTAESLQTTQSDI